MKLLNGLFLTLMAAMLTISLCASAQQRTSSSKPSNPWGDDPNPGESDPFLDPNPANPNPIFNPPAPRQPAPPTSPNPPSVQQGLSFDANVPVELKAQVQDDLSFMASLQGSAQTPYHKEIFGSLSGDAYKTFFATRIQRVGLDNCGLGMAVACVKTFWDPNKMWFTKNFVNYSHPQIARLMIIYHESRHSETAHDNWGHDDCPTPFLDEQGKDKVSIWTGAKLEGMPACDGTQYGSYGSSTILLKNVAKYCTNCTEKVRMDADMFADDQMGRIDDPKVKTDMLSDFNAQAQ